MPVGIGFYRFTELMLRAWFRNLRKDVRTTMIYTHVIKRGGMRVRSPLEML